MIAVLMLLAQACPGQDITTTDGKTYRQCEIVRVEIDELSVKHADGAARIPYEKLPVDLQQRYFDPAKVAEYRNRVEAERKVEEARIAEEERVRKEVAAKEESARLEAARLEAVQRAAAEKQEFQRRKDEEVKKIAVTIGWVAAGLALFGLSLMSYFLPSFVGRHKANARAIFVLNLFLGWTFIGWVIALVWASTKDSAMETLARQRIDATNGRGRYLE